MLNYRKIDPNHYLYPQIRRECEGVVDAVYWPEKDESHWLCTCGTENGLDAADCSACHVSLSWLEEHFDRNYLSEKQLSHDKEQVIERQKTREKTKKKASRSRSFRRLALLSVLVLLIVGIFFLFQSVILPKTAYAKAESLRESGQYLEAGEAFEALGYREEAAACRRIYAQKLAGKDDVFCVSTKDHPEFSIQEDGTFKVNYDLFKDSANCFAPFVIPDVVDNILVTKISDTCFMNCTFLEGIVFPESVTAIGERAFFKCTGLKTITLPQSLTVLGERAFINCSSLETIQLPLGISEIPIRCFNNCTALRQIELVTSLTKIGDYAFSGCSALSSLVLDRQLKAVGDYAFSGCEALETVVYYGTQSQFDATDIGTNNESLLAHVTLVPFDTDHSN